MTMTIKIWDIISGPTSREDSEDADDYPDECDQMLVCKAEIDGEIVAVDYWFEHIDDANEWVKHFKTSIEPLEINCEGEHDA
tara:strand:- start:192 stop:437 length:246 start_codon:yes stop_codon:yes gene_type:complete